MTVLQVGNKEGTKNKVGDDLFLKIRRGFSTPQPALTLKDKRYARFDKKYKNLDALLLPVNESLKETRERVIQHFFEQIAPQLVKKLYWFLHTTTLYVR